MNDDIRDKYNYKDFLATTSEVSFVDSEGREYVKVVCIKEYKDVYAKRVIKKGEIGGEIAKGLCPEWWIEEGQRVGYPTTEVCRLTVEKKKKIDHSKILLFKDEIAEIMFFWLINYQTREKSIYNACISHTERIPQIAAEMFDIEEKYIAQPNNTNESQLIILWVLLGAIQEAILKMHLVARRDYYNDFIEKNKSIEKVKVNVILNQFKNDETIDNHEYIILEKINGNRNLIHILNNESVYGYEIYCEYVNELYGVLKKLYGIEKSTK